MNYTIEELPIDKKGTVIYINVLWSTRLEIKIGTKYYTIRRPKGKHELNVTEGEFYEVIKIKYGRSYKLTIKEKKVIKKVTGRSQEQIKEDVKDERDEFYKELEMKTRHREAEKAELDWR